MRHGDAAFEEVVRPVNSGRGASRSVAVEAVLGTVKTGKAIAFKDKADAHRAYMATAAVLRRVRMSRPGQYVRLSGLTVWVEDRSVAQAIGDTGGER